MLANNIKGSFELYVTELPLDKKKNKKNKNSKHKHNKK